MVLAGRGWLVYASRAACGNRNACARLLLLSGLVAIAWLAGGIGVAHGETAPEPGSLVDRVLDAGDSTESTGQTAAQELRGTRLSETAARAASATESLTDTAVPQVAALPAGALGEANDLVDGIAHRGKDVVESTDQSLRGGRLMDTVTEGLTDSTRAVHGRIDGAVNTTVPLGLPVLGAVDGPATNSDGSRDRRTETDGDRDAEQASTDAGTAVYALADSSVWRSAAAEAAERVHDDDPGERIRLIGGGAHHSAGADASGATGATAPSFPAPGTAGFLMARADHMAPRVQRVALPGDPTLVVRDAADDPSFSPD